MRWQAAPALEWFGLVDLGRNPVLLVLLLIVPAVFVSKATTPARPLVVAVAENGTTSNQPFWLPEIHAGAMAPVGIGALAALVGMFVVVDAAGGDRRLRLPGYPISVVLAARLGVVGRGRRRDHRRHARGYRDCL